MAWVAPKDDWAAGDVLTAAQMNIIGDGLQEEPGTVHLGTFTATAASSLDAQSVFSADFANYQFVATITAMSAGTGSVGFRFMNGATPASGAIYANANWTWASDATSGASGGGSDTSVTILNASGAGFVRGACKGFLSDPFTNDYSQFQISSTKLNTSTSFRAKLIYGSSNTATGYDGITLFPSSGTITGTLQVFGMAPRA